MKKTKQSRDATLIRILGGYIAVSGMSQEEIADGLGITSRCLYSKLKTPNMFRLGELRLLCEMLQVSEEDRIKMYVG